MNQLEKRIELERAMRAKDDDLAIQILSEAPDLEDVFDPPDVCACGRLLGPSDSWVHCAECVA